jgi:hypothetical protein
MKDSPGSRAVRDGVHLCVLRSRVGFREVPGRTKSGLPDAILMVTDYLTVLNRKPVFEFATANKVLAILESSTLVRDGTA